MTVATALILMVSAASLLLFMRAGARLVPAIALAVSALELLLAFRIVQLGLKGVPLDLVLGGALATCGALLYLRVSHKTLVAAATVVALVGAVQVLSAVL